MDFKAYLTDEVKQFIAAYKNASLADIALKLNKQNLPKTFIINQINGIQKAKQKLPEFYNNPEIVYPQNVSMEQCSSETTAKFKAGLIKGKTILDLTGGFGVDAYYLKDCFEKIIFVEPENDLLTVVKHNFKLFKHQFEYINTTAEEFLVANHHLSVDCIYLDPSRRIEGKKVIQLQDYAPNIVELQEKLLGISNQILLKTSPMLDIKKTLNQLQNIKNIYIVGIKNEVKEVLYLIQKNYNKEPDIQAINLNTNQPDFKFKYSDETASNIQYSSCKSYLYEPNAAILKAGAFKSVGEKYKILKIDQHTHLYTSDNLVENFPGRILKVLDTFEYKKASFDKLHKAKGNVVCKNFTKKPESIKQKFKIIPNNEIFIYFYSKNKLLYVTFAQKLNIN